LTAPVDYLGDGLYASFNGFTLELATAREEPSKVHWVRMDEHVFENLIRYAIEHCDWHDRILAIMQWKWDLPNPPRQPRSAGPETTDYDGSDGGPLPSQQVK
jgi:hypothetical protein